MSINTKTELRFAALSLAVSAVMFAGLFHFLFQRGQFAIAGDNTRLLLETILFSAAMLFIAYGNALYHICLMGYYKRLEQHRPATREALDKMYDGHAPALTVLIPSYKEERNVNWQTMLSAALAEYPGKQVVLLIDDPHRPVSRDDRRQLEDTRTIPGQLQRLFDAPKARLCTELDAFHQRRDKNSFCYEAELARLADLYDEVSGWLEKLAGESAGGQPVAALPHTDRFFIETIIGEPLRQHKSHASALRKRIDTGEIPGEDFLERQYKRLSGLFDVCFSSFERKKYANLSHEANKAMNLNSYIALVGKSWREVEINPGELHLVEAAEAGAHFTIPPADYIDTIDADSMMRHEYLLRMVYLLEQRGNERLAVVQSTCSAFPGCTNPLERVAGACLDVQFLTHQGYTHWNATFWVGANAMLRKRALEDIRETREENGHTVSVYIQDRTVIEDTESSIDLINKGWNLYNYPERMTFSANPPDFGALLIQRRRWANGGLLFLPKLVRYFIKSPKTPLLFKEIFMRFNYLASTTIGCVVGWIFFLYPFGEVFSTPFLGLSTVPFLLLYARDLKNAGYRYSDTLRVCALNLMLVPVVTGGVLKSLQQITTGKKIPFCRTPKVSGRTAAPALYSLLELLFPLALLAASGHDLYKEQWSQAVFTALNAGFFVYALIHFVGVKAAIEDISVGLRARWKKVAAQSAEIIPLPVSPMARMGEAA